MKKKLQISIVMLLSIALALSICSCGKPGTSSSIVPGGTSSSTPSDPGSSSTPSNPGSSSTPSDPGSDTPSDAWTSTGEFVYADNASGVVSGDELRSSVVERVMDIMNVDYTIQNRISWTNIGDEKTAAFPEAGILPNTYFNYTRYYFPYKGVMVETTPASFEQFQATLDMSQSVIPGIGHTLTPAADHVGMDMNTFLTDISSRVLANPLTGVKAALTSEDLVALYTGANFDAASSMEAVASADEVKAAYAKLQKGDLLLSWNNNAKIKLVGMETDADVATLDPKIHALVVKDVDHAAGTVTVMYNMYAKTLSYFKCDTCGLIETEGPTSAVIPIHWDNDNKTLRRHRQTDRESECKGRWTAMYGTTWRTETVTYDQLFGQGELNVPFGSTGYLPYTFKNYESGLNLAEVKMETAATSASISGGFQANISSDYPITAIKAVLTAEGSEGQEFFLYPNMNTKSVEFYDDALNEVLKGIPEGTMYKLDLYVRSGPLSGDNQATDDYREYAHIVFDKKPANVGISTDSKYVQQGGAFNVSVNSLVDGTTAAQVSLTYADSLYELDLEASKTANPEATFTVDEEKSMVTVTRIGGVCNKGDSIAQVVFRAKRTGEMPVEAAETGKIMCALASFSDKAGATAADLVACAADPTPVQLGMGYNVELRENYVGDYDLILVYMATDHMRFERKTQQNMTYSGVQMYEITDSKYRVDDVPGQGFLRIYGYIGKDLKASMISHDDAAQMAETIYSYDVNQSGSVDLNDVQAIANVMSGAIPLEGNEVKWFMADINRDGKVDENDQQTLWDILTK